MKLNKYIGYLTALIAASFTSATGCYWSGEVGECVEDSTCEAGRICENFLCVEGCRDDSVCGDGRICEDLVCVTGKRCAGDEDCGSGTSRICLAGLCVVGCREDMNCDQGQICEALTCRTGCRVDSDCGIRVGKICSNLVCVSGCNDDGDCGLDEICEATVCAAGKRCSIDSDCGQQTGKICTSDLCVPGCRGDSDCPDEQICESQTCVNGCRGDGDCGVRVGKICNDFICVAGCNVDDDCAIGDICQSKSCVSGQRCDADQDCGLGIGKICSSNVCVNGCRIDDDCAPDYECKNLQCKAGVRIIGCSDGKREGFRDLSKYPTIAGCNGYYNSGFSLRDPPTGVSCGGDLPESSCGRPADLCAVGWHICSTNGYPQDISSRISAVQCESVEGTFMAAMSAPSPYDDYSCHEFPFPCEGQRIVCCGGGCSYKVCPDAIWPGNTVFLDDADQTLLDFPSCESFIGSFWYNSSYPYTINAGVMCCKEPAVGP